MTGIGTVLADDPDLTCRIPGYARRQTIRIVADGTLRTPPAARLIATARQSPTWLLHHAENPPAAQRLEEAGAICIQVPKEGQHIDLAAALTALGNFGLTRILVEGGAELAASLLRSDLIDRIVWFHAPSLIGGDGRPAVLPFGVEHIGQMKHFSPLRPPSAIGSDVMTEFSRI
jgi:diaminohydroxyphosphoribosylaminopyrimidine deaminase/5-amino-6-(5-phosphoribosylamino)uracil reductase